MVRGTELHLPGRGDPIMLAEHRRVVTAIEAGGAAEAERVGREELRQRLRVDPARAERTAPA